MTDKDLLNEIKKAGLLDEAGATKLEREALLSGKKIEELIARSRSIDSKKLAELKSGLLKVPFKKIDLEHYDEKLLTYLPEETARTYGAAPMGIKDNLLVLGMIHPDDLKSQDALKFIARRSNMNLGVYLISYDDWQDILRRYSPYKSEIEKAIQTLNIKPGGSAARTISLEESRPGMGEEAPVIKIVADTFREAVKMGASDVHIEPQENFLRIRFRVNGDLKQEAALPVELASSVTSRVKVISSLKIDEMRVPQDGRFRSKIYDRDIDFRVATFPTPLGEKVAIRVLDPRAGLKSFDALGLRGKNFDMVKEGLEKPFGMVLVTGPTGSGKSTTLYALLQSLNDESVNVVSLEDPVEYFVSGINQSQVHPEIGYDFASGLRQILRQDPDVIMVGEIRDNETAGLAVQAALTGHIVLSTLHTNNSAGVIPRLIDMKVEPFLVPVSLNIMIAQRLVGLLCPDCKTAEVVSPELQRIVKKALEGVPESDRGNYGEPYKSYHAKGCNRCKGKGIVGRMAVFEVFRMTPAVEEIVANGPTVQRLLTEAKKQGMLTMRQDGVLKALDGFISLEEVVRETVDE